MPLAAAMVRVDAPDPPVMLIGFGAPVRPVGRAAESVTVSVNPFNGVTVIVEGCEVPFTMVSVVGLGVRVKPATFTASWVVCMMLPLVPWMSTM